MYVPSLFSTTASSFHHNPSVDGDLADEQAGSIVIPINRLTGQFDQREMHVQCRRSVFGHRFGAGWE